jgi:hypothetical protein
MHNFKQYDCHLLLKGMQKFSEGKVTAIPVNSEKFLSIVCDKYVFLDSMMFLSASLDELVRNLLGSSPTKDYFKNNFKVLDQVFGSDLGMKLARMEGTSTLTAGVDLRSVISHLSTNSTVH